MAATGWTPLVSALRGCARVLLTGPTAPDGDSIGACLALQRVLEAPGREVDVAGDPGFRYRFLPGAAHMVPDDAVTPGYEAVVVLDGDRHRLTRPVARAFDAAAVRGIIDHHASTRCDGYTHAWVEAEATSTCEMLYDAFVADGQPLDPALAELLYVGAIFDTGGFRYSNTTPATHRMAARLLELGIDHAALNARVLMVRRPAGMRAAGEVFTGASFHLGGRLVFGEVSASAARRLELSPGDLEGIVDHLVHVAGVEVAVLASEREGGRVKLSLRSRGLVNVAEVAQRLSPSGGGHAKAAGASMDGTLAAAQAAVVNAVADPLGAPTVGAG